MGPEPCCSQCFFSHFGSHFRNKAKKSGFCGSGVIFPFLGCQNPLFHPKSGKSRKSAKVEKSRFSLQAPNPLKHKHLGTFLEPETHKCAFSLLGSLFRLGAFVAQKVLQGWKICRISLFCFQKWENRVFAILVKKSAQNVTFIKGFALLSERMEIAFFTFSIFF